MGQLPASRRDLQYTFVYQAFETVKTKPNLVEDAMSARQLSRDELSTIAEEAYVFGFPILMGYRNCFASFLATTLPSYRVPLNTMHGDPVTLDHNFKDVITPSQRRSLLARRRPCGCAYGCRHR